MSADSRVPCPRCCKRTAKAMDTAYGKVSKQEYRRLCQEAEDAANDDNLEEYYGLDFDAEKQECHIRFEAHCEVCGFEFIFKHTEKVDLK